MNFLKRFNESSKSMFELIDMLENINDIISSHKDEYNYDITFEITNPEDHRRCLTIIDNDVKSSINSDPNFFTYNYHREVLIVISFGDYESYKSHRNMIDNILGRLNAEYPNTFRIVASSGFRLARILSSPIKY